MLSNHPNVLGGNGPSTSSDLIGDVDGPASATDNALSRFDGTTGKVLQNSVVTVSDTGAIAGAASLSVTTTVNTGGYTVATLPAGVVGDRAYVTDATAPAYNTPLTGGGAVVVPVFRNATVWVSA